MTGQPGFSSWLQRQQFSVNYQRGKRDPSSLKNKRFRDAFAREHNNRTVTLIGQLHLASSWSMHGALSTQVERCFATLRVLSRLRSSGLRCLCCDPEASILGTEKRPSQQKHRRKHCYKLYRRWYDRCWKYELPDGNWKFETVQLVSRCQPLWMSS